MTNTEIMTYDAIDEARADQAAKNVGNMGTYCGSLKVYTISAIREAARLAREGWAPPEPVDPDLEEAEKISKNSHYFFGSDSHPGAILAAIRRGRALAAAEAQPGMVWVKHDGSKVSPVKGMDSVWVKDQYGTKSVQLAVDVHWPNVTHYCLITQPEDAA